MKKHRQVSTCPVCGKKANKSRKYVKAKSGKIYHYGRFYHGPKSIHFLKTDSSFSNFQKPDKRTRNLYLALTEYVTRRMRTERVTYTSLKKEMEMSFDGAVYNEEFNRSLKKAVSAGLIEKTIWNDKPSYSKTPEVDLKERLKFEQVTLNYDFSKKQLVVSAFLEPTNIGQIPIKKIPFFIPYGPLDSVDFLKLKIHDETDEIMPFMISIPFSTTLETGISITLNKNLSSGEKDLVFVKYTIPKPDSQINFLAQAPVNALRITVIAEKGYDVRILKTLINGAKETVISFPRHYFYKENYMLFQVELDSLSKGENISVRLAERHDSSQRPNM